MTMTLRKAMLNARVPQNVRAHRREASGRKPAQAHLTKEYSTKEYSQKPKHNRHEHKNGRKNGRKKKPHPYLRAPQYGF